MDDLFAPPGNPWQPVSPALRHLRRTVLLLWTAVALVVGLVAWPVLGLPGWTAGAASAVLVGVLVAAWLLIGRNVRFWGYAEREEDLYIKHGALFRELVAVPYGRMQYVDVTAGPLEQLFKVSTVHLHTASPGTSARIPGLPREEAARLRDRLTSLGNAQAAGL